MNKFDEIINHDDFELYKNQIINCDFNNIYKQFNETTRKKITDALFDIALSGNINAYGCISYFLLKENKDDFQSIAAEIFNCGNFIKGSYKLGFYHSKEALSLEPFNVKKMEQVLFYNIMPNQLLSDSEAEDIINKILNIDKNNQFA